MPYKISIFFCFDNVAKMSYQLPTLDLTKACEWKDFDKFCLYIVYIYIY